MAEPHPPAVIRRHPAPATAPVPRPGDLGDVPEYYRDFIRQSDQVLRRLRKLGEPEMAAVTAPAAAGRAVQTTSAFQQAAHRHRSGPA